MDQDLCANCDHWREEHYNRSGAFIGDRLFNCVEYQGTTPADARRKNKEKELKESREAAHKLRI